MNDLVYIVGRGSPWQDNELRYSLRSVQTYLKDYRRVFIVGKKPDFLNDEVIHIPFQDVYTNKARNIMTKIYRVCGDQRITDNFMFFNDDYFCLQPFSAKDYPYYYKCDLNHTVRIQHNEYRKHCEATLRVLNENKLPINNFDVHYPIIYNKGKFRKMADRYYWNIPFGYIAKSMYCNHYGIEGVFRLDCKITNAYPKEHIHKLNEGREIFSVGDPSLNTAMKTYLMNLFPNKSRYEL